MSQLITMIHLSNAALIEHYHSRLPSNLQGADHKPYWCVSATEEKLRPLEEGETAPEYTVNRLAMVESGTGEEVTYTLPEVDLTDGNVYEMPLAMFRLFKDKAGVFDAPEPEPVPEPRYKTKMTPEEFVRDLVGFEKWAAIETVALTDPRVGAWRDITVAGQVWVEHLDFKAGLQLGQTLVLDAATDTMLFTAEEVAKYSKGLLIQ